MKKTLSLILLILTMLLSNPVYAIWVSNDEIINLNVNITLQTGQWTNPFLDSVITDVESNKGYYPKGTIYRYNDLLYIVTSNNFNSRWHSLDAPWATASLELNWVFGRNYTKTSVVKYKNQYYIANNNYSSYYLHNPESTQNWGNKPWLKIEYMNDNMFEKIEGTNIPNYSQPVNEYIIYQ